MLVLRDGLTGPNPTDGGKAGTNRHVVVDANAHVCELLEAAVDAITPARNDFRGRRPWRPRKSRSDEGGDCSRCPKACPRGSIVPLIARGGTASS